MLTIQQLGILQKTGCSDMQEAASEVLRARALLREWVARGFPMGGSEVWDATNRYLAEIESMSSQDQRATERK